MKKILSTLSFAVLVAANNPVLAYPSIMETVGASSCLACHVNADGGAPWKAGVLDAYDADGIEGLKAFLFPDEVLENTPPTVQRINKQWNITVGEAPLLIDFWLDDIEGDDLNVIAKELPKGAKLFESIGGSKKWTFSWRPTLEQAGNYRLTFFAKENATDEGLTSKKLTTKIRVWKPRKNAETSVVRRFEVQTAFWRNDKLTIKGTIQFRPTIAIEEREIALESLTLGLRTASGSVFSPRVPLKFKPIDHQTNTWKVVLPANDLKFIPCNLMLNYEGLKAIYPIKKAPKETCVK